MLVTAILVAIALGLMVIGLVTALSLRKRLGNRDLRLIGESCCVETTLTPEGTVIIRGELWPARSTEGVITSPRRVRVVGVNNLALLVEPCE